MFKLAVLAGDGIGPEIVREALKVLAAAGKRFGFEFETEKGLIGGAAIDAEGSALPLETIDLCRRCDTVLLGAIGGPKWDNTDPGGVRPEQGLLAIRKELELYANLRPVKVYPALADSSTLRPAVVEGVDLLVVRELTGGLYFGASGRENGRAFDTCEYSRSEVERLMRVAFDLAGQRRERVHSVDKANVLESSRLWRETAEEVARDYPDVELSHMLVDNCAMQLIRDPLQFDVIATENMFGDILSDEGAMITGSLGMLASASIGAGPPSLYEPAHGSAPDIAGQGAANPLATILSVSMMLRFSLDLVEAGQAIDSAVSSVLDQGHRTADIAAAGESHISTGEMGDLVASAIVKE